MFKQSEQSCYKIKNCYFSCHLKPESAMGGGERRKCLRSRMFYGADVAGIVRKPHAIADRAGLPSLPGPGFIPAANVT